jgi:tripartite ATP-independent transporter DctP family solute receptor
MRRAIKRSGMFAGAAATLGNFGILRSPARAAQFEYKLAHVDPVEYPASVRMVQMADAVYRETNGRMKIQVFPNALLGSTTSILTQVRLGSVQFSWINHSTYSSVVPIAQIDSVGFVFDSEKRAFSALDGALGAYIRKEFAAKGLYVFEKTSSSSFHQMISSTRPIRTVNDFAGFKVRTLASPLFIDLFKTLGASAVAIDSNEMYTAAQTHVVDGLELALGIIEAYRIFEVQKYISITNHLWTGYWLAANGETWNALPGDIQAVVQRNAAKYTLLERTDIAAFNASVGDKLQRQGITFNTADTTGMRARLSPYYNRWKNEFGSTAWDLLEATTGKLT